MVHRHPHRHQLRDALAFAAPEPAPAQTFVSVVYVTASKTFDGPIAGYMTAKVDNSPPPPPPAVAAPAVSNNPKPAVSSTPKTAATSSPAVFAQQKKSSSGTELPSSIDVASTSLDSNVPLLAAAPTTAAGPPTPASFLATSTDTSKSSSSKSASSDSGMNVGAKAGLAIGIILLVGTALALILFFIKKRRNTQKEREHLSEKEMFAPASPKPERALSTRTTATAPRLSLRPVTQFIPNFGANTEKALPAIGPEETNRDNPFGSHAETIDSANANGPAVLNNVGAGGEFLAAGAAAGAAAGGAGAGLARGASRRGAKPLDLTNSGPFMANLGPPSPTGTEFSMSSEGPNTPVQTSSSAAIAAAGGPANSSVHRVQLDFKPSMDDELELHAGQLIRMLHEYDDGWALCIRLDRSRQGVVPRTCLSTRPVKPRLQQNGPRGPPPPSMRNHQQQQRPQSPSHGQGYPPAMNRPMTPNGGPQNRAMTPNSHQGRPMTPQGRQTTPTGPQYKPQGPTTSMADRRQSPPSPLIPTLEVSEAPAAGPTPGPVVRKPVGQAL